VEDRARGAAQRAMDNPAVEAVARSGYAASGILQGLVGVIAVQVALQGSDQQADQSGALDAIVRAPGGAVLVWLIAVGGLALALWLLIDGVLEQRADRSATWKERLKAWGKALVYLVIGITALRVALGAGASSSRSTERGTATLLGLPGGQVLLVLVGIGVVVTGGVLVQRGATAGFRDTIRIPPGRRGDAVLLLGRVGYIARGVAIAVVGVLFVVAAVRTDPGEASGLDGALRAFAGLPFGAVVLVAIGAGWIASGCYTVLRARLARIGG